MEFHESKQFAADDRQVVLVDVDETVCFIPMTDNMIRQSLLKKI